MATFESGLTYEQLRGIVDNNAISSISSGTVRKNGKKLQACISYMVDGKRKYLTHNLEGTVSTGRDATGKRDAKTLLSDWRDQVIADARSIAGISVDPTSPVRECMSSFIEAKESVGQIRSSTATNYRNAAKRIERYPLADMPLISLTTGTIQTMVNDMSRRLSGKSVKLSIDLLSAVCKKYLGCNSDPCEGLIMPKLNANAKQKAKRPNALTIEGVIRMNALLDDLDGKGQDTNIMSLGARLALHTGVRAEEACGLRWRDVDFMSKSIHIGNVIERAEIPVRNEDGEAVRKKDGTIKTTYSEYAAPPKTDRSERDIPMDPEIAEALMAHRRRVESSIIRLFPKKSDRPAIDGLYVLGDLNGNFFSPRRLGVRWIRFAKRNDLIGTENRPCTYHDIRHTCASRMLAAGVDIATVSMLLGHSENSVTLNKYTTSDERTKRAAIDGMAGIFSARQVPDADVAQGLAPVFEIRPTGTSN